MPTGPTERTRGCLANFISQRHSPRYDQFPLNDSTTLPCNPFPLFLEAERFFLTCPPASSLPRLQRPLDMLNLFLDALHTGIEPLSVDSKKDTAYAVPDLISSWAMTFCGATSCSLQCLIFCHMRRLHPRLSFRFRAEKSAHSCAEPFRS